MKRRERLDRAHFPDASWRLPILRYNSVTESSPRTALPGSVPACRLREQLMFLRRQGWRLLGLTEALNYVRSRPSNRAVALTFDGGLLDFLVAWRVLSDIGAKATLYIPLELVGMRISRWDRGFSRLHWEHLQELAGEGFELGVQLITKYELGNVHAVDKLALDRELLQGRANTEVSSFSLVAKRPKIPPEVHHVLVRAGYQIACTLRQGVARSMDDPFLMPRLRIRMNESGETVHQLMGQDKPTLISNAGGTLLHSAGCR